jgi:hypothetical protein
VLLFLQPISTKAKLELRDAALLWQAKKAAAKKSWGQAEAIVEVSTNILSKCTRQSRNQSNEEKQIKKNEILNFVILLLLLTRSTSFMGQC